MNNYEKIIWFAGSIFMLSIITFVWFTPDTVNPTVNTIEPYKNWHMCVYTCSMYGMLISGLLALVIYAIHEIEKRD